MPKFKNYVFTLNNYSVEEEEALKKLECKYICFGKEIAPTTKTPHLQGMVCFQNQRSFDQVKSIFPIRTHLEPMRGRVEQSQVYCKKDGTWFENGIPPQSNKKNGEIEKERYEDAWKLAKEGKIEEIDADLRIRHYHTIKRIYKDYQVRPEDKDHTTGYWFHGPPGTGKSFTARMENPNAYIKSANKWWDGYQGEEVVILDDLDLMHKVLGHHLKIWGDAYAFNAEDKGGSRMIRPKRIIVTSNYTIEFMFAGDEDMIKAILRRYRCREFPEGSGSP